MQLGFLAFGEVGKALMKLF